MKTPTGKIIALEVMRTDTIENIKAMVQDKEGFLPKHLFCDNRQLEDGVTLSYYNEALLQLHPVIELKSDGDTVAIPIIS